MEYRVSLAILNDDEDPSPESVRHLLIHLLKGAGLVWVTVKQEDSHDIPDDAAERPLA